MMTAGTYYGDNIIMLRIEKAIWTICTYVVRTCSLPKTFRYELRSNEKRFIKTELSSLSEYFLKRFSFEISQIWTLPATCSTIGIVLSFIQTKADYENVMQHMMPQVSMTSNLLKSEAQLYQGLDIFGRYVMKKLHIFREQLDDPAHLVIYPKTLTHTQLNSPIQQNQAVLDIINASEQF